MSYTADQVLLLAKQFEKTAVSAKESKEKSDSKKSSNKDKSAPEKSKTSLKDKKLKKKKKASDYYDRILNKFAQDAKVEYGKNINNYNADGTPANTDATPIDRSNSELTYNSVKEMNAPTESETETQVFDSTKNNWKNISENEARALPEKSRIRVFNKGKWNYHVKDNEGWYRDTSPNTVPTSQTSPQKYTVNPEVAMAQNWLIGQGYKNLLGQAGADGKLGPNTIKALKARFPENTPMEAINIIMNINHVGDQTPAAQIDPDLHKSRLQHSTPPAAQIHPGLQNNR